MHPYYGLSPLESFTDAIAAAKPDLIVPGDDLATRHLYDLHRHARHLGKEGAHTRELIERSLGAPESFQVLYERARFIEAARQEGVAVPQTEVIRNVQALREYIERVGFPVALKANGTSGGEGVRVVRTMEEAERAFRVLQAPPSAVRALKRAVVDLDTRLIRPVLLRRGHVVNAQAFVAGHDATSLVACWKGAVLGSLHFEVLNKQYSDGPASVLRRIENAEMAAAAEKMVGRLKLSGLYGFDFMIEAQTENPYLIEINPRTTQVAHLTFGPGCDLPAALYAAVSGARVQESPVVTDNPPIALFPPAWTRNPASAFLKSGYHDIPGG
ncbi:MAG: ATP-grasp domain-containing protein, partial [Candidatus Binataceae bacterium]